MLFMRENEEKYGFPHPYVEGFKSIETDRIVAPFWADVDMTLGIGEVFYQVSIFHTPVHETEISIEAEENINWSYN